MKIVIFGSTGQVGSAIIEKLENKFELFIAKKDEINFLNPYSVVSYIDKIRPKIIINAAAYTNVDMAEKDSEKKNALITNFETPSVITKISKEIGALLIHFSTDYVFNGKHTEKYLENDIPSPLNIYGKTKLKADRFIFENLSTFFILRTSWVFSENKKNFVSKIINLCSNREYINVVSDQTGTPTSANYIANTTIKLIEHYLIQKENTSFGLYNIAGKDEISWYNFAKFILENAEKLGLISNKNFKGIFPILSKNYKQLARRPKYSSLNVKKLNDNFGLKPCDWKSDVNLILEKFTHEKK